MAAAARRVSKSSVDWATFYSKVPGREQELYRAMKSRSDYFINRVHSNPESLGKIDFAYYRTMLPALRMVDEFEAAYSKVQVPYPVDKQNTKDKIAKEEADMAQKSAQLVKELEHEKVLSTLYLEKLNALPSFDHWNDEMKVSYFPDLSAEAKFDRIENNPKKTEYSDRNESVDLNNLLKKVGINVKI